MEARYWVVTDLETTGLDPNKHEIIEIARVTVDIVTRSIVPGSLYHDYVVPTRWETRSSQAMEVNNIDLSLLSDQGVPLKHALVSFSRDINWENSVLASWGIDFELKFLKNAFIRAGRPIPYRYQAVDIRSLMMMILAKNRQADILGLSEACQGWGLEWSPELAHSAVYDADKTAQLLVEMLND